MVIFKLILDFFFGRTAQVSQTIEFVDFSGEGRPVSGVEALRGGKYIEGVGVLPSHR